jgi:hypothetical protein
VEGRETYRFVSLASAAGHTCVVTGRGGVLRTLGTSLHLEINVTCTLKLGRGKAEMCNTTQPTCPKFRIMTISPSLKIKTFVPKNVGVKFNLIFLHILHCAFGRCNILSTPTYFTFSEHVEFASIP